jgi:ribose transport system ATP-binding protein
MGDGAAGDGAEAADVTGQGAERAVPAIDAAGIGKSYGAVQALTDVSFDALPGEIHALVGENGAGKSTLIKILCGVTRPDAGTARVCGTVVRGGGQDAAARHGVGVVFQELTLLPWLTVAENLLLHREPRGALGLIRRRKLPGRAAGLLAEYGAGSVDPRSLVADLSLAQRQVVEIVRAVSARPRVLFLDEPTSSLADAEVRWLFGLVRALRDSGTCVVFTSHRWREVTSLADRITVFRGGQRVATRDRLDEEEAVRLMTGRTLAEVSSGTTDPPRGRVALEVSGLTGGPLRDVSFSLHEGEILGIGGLEGQGQRELFLALFGVQRAHGEISAGGKPARLRSPKDAIRAGMSIALVPEDRKGEGLFLPMSVRQNLTLPVLRTISTAGLVRSRAERDRARGAAEQMRIGIQNDSRPVDTLSGGNQQKVLLGRWLLADARILLLYDVTRGVDMATKQDFYQLMLDLTAQGRSILFYSSDTREVARLAHRVLVLREGRVSAELDGPRIDPERIVSAAVSGAGTAGAGAGAGTADADAGPGTAGTDTGAVSGGESASW